MRITSTLAWEIYNLLNDYKAGHCGVRPLQEVLDERFGGIEYLNTLFKKALVDHMGRFLEDFDYHEPEYEMRDRIKFEFKDGDQVWKAACFVDATLFFDSFIGSHGAWVAWGEVTYYGGIISDGKESHFMPDGKVKIPTSITNSNKKKQ